jgi:predicted permease
VAGFLRQVIEGFRALLRGRRPDLELDEELRGFIEAAAEAKSRAGVPRDRASRDARLELGGVEAVKEHVRDVGWETCVGTLVQDVRYGLRLMRRTPVVTTAAMLSLALGIGANTAIFTLIDAVALRRLPVERPDELRQISMFTPPSTEESSSFTNVLWEQVRDHQDVFSSAFAWGQARMDLAAGGEAHYAAALFASGLLFESLGVRPAAGRLLMASDDVAGCAGAAVLAHGFWMDHYGGDPSVVGRSVTLDRHTFPIVGVAQDGFTGLNVGWKFDVAIPVCAAAAFDPAPTRMVQRSWWWLTVGGRLKPGVTTEAANAQLAAISSGVMDGSVPLNWKPDMQRRFRTRVLVTAPAATGLSGLRRAYSQPLRVLLSISVVVLLIACANIASLLLARASARRKELAVRLAIGASRARLVRQLLTETLLLSVGGAVFGFLIARWGTAALVRAISGPGDPVFLDLSPDARVLGFTVLMTLATGLLVGWWPAIRATRTDPGAGMKGDAAGMRAGEARSRPGFGIVAVQIALCLALVAVSGLFLRSFVNLVTVDLGFDRSRLLIVSAAARTSGAQSDQRLMFEAIEARIAALPGVRAVSHSILSPLGPAQWDNDVSVEGPHRNPADRDTMLNYVSPGYFRTLAIPLRAGRDFSAADASNSAPVAVVNEALVRRFFGDESAVGRRFHFDASRGEAAPSIEIVGIVADARYSSLRSDFPPTAFFPIAQLPGGTANADFQVRTSAADPASMAPAIGREASAIDGTLSLEFHAMDEHLDRAVRQERLLAVLSTFFGGLALLLASVGLYGNIAYAVARRQKETGIRLALGASPGVIVRMILREAIVLVGLGVLAGCALAAATTRFTQALLFNLTPTDPATFAGAAAALAIVGLAAAAVPARRAARVDPLASLRRE